MLDGLEEIGHLTGIRPASLDVRGLPVDVGHLIADIRADDVVPLDLLHAQMRIVDAHEDDALVRGGLDDHAEVELGHWDEAIIVAILGQIQWRLHTLFVGQRGNTIHTSIAVHIQLVLGHPGPQAILHTGPIAGIEGLPLGSSVDEQEGGPLLGCVIKVSLGSQMTTGQVNIAGTIKVLVRIAAQIVVDRLQLSGLRVQLVHILAIEIASRLKGNPGHTRLIVVAAGFQRVTSVAGHLLLLVKANLHLLGKSRGCNLESHANHNTTIARGSRFNRLESRPGFAVQILELKLRSAHAEGRSTHTTGGNQVLGMGVEARGTPQLEGATRREFHHTNVGEGIEVLGVGLQVHGLGTGQTSANSHTAGCERI
ncbi:hypothetical protein M5D96_005235 [Drosophila gunungcola]|uniref:Uncharacterized protein n=1 Tax=Drosophila gunungcola TaxID=103775 RepID=A0A9Q0BQZ7_9MUSC|nr:hypothetical protein M5D96_005235 [Drosophila gunungcola]